MRPVPASPVRLASGMSNTFQREIILSNKEAQRLCWAFLISVYRCFATATVGSQYAFTEKQRTAQQDRYRNNRIADREKARGNPGNGQVFDPAHNAYVPVAQVMG